MKKVKLFEEYMMSDMVQEIHRLHDGELNEEQINQLINEGFFDWIKGIFLNPMKKRKLRQLADKLVDVRVELGKLKIEQDQIEELQDEAEAKAEEDPYTYSTTSRPSSYRSSSSSRSSNDGSAAFQLKEDSLTAMEEAIIDNMDAIGAENETLQKYVSTVKLDARMRSTEKLIKMADSEVKRILVKSLKKDKSAVDSLQKEIKASLDS
ncbi:MAG: hypothetical protein ACOVOV_00725 [Dolichospermum sp.]|jgi:hypothetical protein